MELLDGIYTRRSVRQYSEEPVKRDDLLEILKAGTWAPSGLNNQPWRFVLIRKEQVLCELAMLTTSRQAVESSNACIAVFVDPAAMYNDVKDHQAAGACIQNMLLAAHALGLGAVWLGEIVKSADQVRSLLDVPEALELMAVIAIGHPARRNQSSSRRDLSEVLISEI